MTERLPVIPTQAGFHVSAGSHRGFKQILLDCYTAYTPLAVVFALDQDVWPDLRDVYRDIPPDDFPTTLIFRTQKDYHGQEIGDGPGDMFVGDPIQSARNWMAQIMPVWGLNHAHYYAPLNEQDGGKLQDMTWLDIWLLEAMIIAKQNGFKLAFPAFSTGNPRDGEVSWDDYSLEERWHELLPALRQAKADGHVLILHEYGLASPGHDNLPATTLQASAPYLALRCFRSLAYLLANGAAPLTYITEASASVGYRPAVYGSITQQQWLDDVKWYDGVLRKYSIFGGFCLYQYGGAENLEEVVPQLSLQIQQQPAPTLGELPYGEGAESMFGLHGRSGSQHREADWTALRLSRPTVSWFKLITNTNVEDINRVIMEGILPEHIVLKLHFDTHRPEVISAAEFVEWQMIHLTRFNALGGKYVEVHNEPNREEDGLGTQWNGPNEFAAWFNQVRAIIKLRFPYLLVGMPGLAPADNVAEWLTGCASAYQMCDWIGVHCYWTAAQLMTHPEHGYYWQRFVQFNKNMIITEFSNPNPLVDKADKANEYLQYVNSLIHPKLKAAICFVVSTPGFDSECWVDEAGNISPIPEIVGDGIVVPPPSLDQVLWDKTVEWQTASGIQLNSKAALQIEIKHDNLWPVTTELYQDNLAFMAAEDPTPNGRARRVYVWQNGQVRWFNKP